MTYTYSSAGLLLNIAWRQGETWWEWREDEQRLVFWQDCAWRFADEELAQWQEMITQALANAPPVYRVALPVVHG